LPRFQKKTPSPVTIPIAGKYFVAVDADDVERVQAQNWSPLVNAQGMTFVAQIDGGAHQLLAGYILGVDPTVYVTTVDKRKPHYYTRSNLRVHVPSARRSA